MEAKRVARNEPNPDLERRKRAYIAAVTSKGRAAPARSAARELLSQESPSRPTLSQLQEGVSQPSAVFDQPSAVFDPPPSGVESIAEFSSEDGEAEDATAASNLDDLQSIPDSKQEDHFQKKRKKNPVLPTPAAGYGLNSEAEPVAANPPLPEGISWVPKRVCELTSRVRELEEDRDITMDVFESMEKHVMTVIPREKRIKGLCAIYECVQLHKDTHRNSVIGQVRAAVGKTAKDGSLFFCLFAVQ